MFFYSAAFNSQYSSRSHFHYELIIIVVQLPPWANGDPGVRAASASALESRHVSERLHHWIDLVFGFKQRGEQAKAAQNVFVHVTYESKVDLDALRDPLERAATLDQIQVRACVRPCE